MYMYMYMYMYMPREKEGLLMRHCHLNNAHDKVKVTTSVSGKRKIQNVYTYRRGNIYFQKFEALLYVWFVKRF